MADKNHQYWNKQFIILQDTWPKPVDFEKCIGICLDLHAMVHTAEVSNSGLWSFEDEFWERMPEEVFRKSYNDDQSIAWKLLHTGRIEDITMNILIANDKQVFSSNWLDRLNIFTWVST